MCIQAIKNFICIHGKALLLFSNAEKVDTYTSEYKMRPPILYFVFCFVSFSCITIDFFFALYRTIVVCIYLHESIYQNFV